MMRWQVPARGVAVAVWLIMIGPALAGTALPPFHRGFNVWPWLWRAAMIDNDPHRFDYRNTWPYLQKFTDRDFEALHRAGADVLRVPVEPNPFMAATEEQRAALAETVVEAVGRVTRLGMTVIVDPHPRAIAPWLTTTILQSPDLTATYKAMIVDLAKALDRRGEGRVILELMNEPPGNWGWRDDYHWLETQIDLVKAIRAVAPTLPILVEGDRGGGIDGLLRVDPKAFDDPAILYSFHYYDPMIVTHQGSDSGTRPYLRDVTGLAYPPDPAQREPSLAALHDKIYADPKVTDPDKAWKDGASALKDYFDRPPSPDSIQADFGRVTAWAKAHNIPARRIILGEFGLFRPAAPLSTVVNHARDVRRAAEASGFAWVYWNYMPFDERDAGFSLLRMRAPNPVALDADILTQGLGLNRP